jgi:hypothetical protein
MDVGTTVHSGRPLWTVVHPGERDQSQMQTEIRTRVRQVSLGERHPENIRGYAHGTVEGYRDAGCTYCEPCAAAGRAEYQRQEERRLTNRLDDHRSRVTSLLAGRFPDLPVEVLVDAAELVVRTHRVRQKYNALLDYYPASVELALNNWVLVARVELDVADIPDLAAAIIEELSP